MIIVNDSSELYAALRGATGGETIALANNGSSYDLKTYNVPNTATPVTITSADPDDPARFSTVQLDGSSNIVFDGLHFGSTPAEAAARQSFLSDFYISNCDNITVRNSVMDGFADGLALPGGQNGTSAIKARNVTGLTIENTRIADYFHGISLTEVEDVTIAHNEITAIQGDGIRMVQIDGVTIDGNYIHDFYGSANSMNHDDMIQLWSTNATDTSRGLHIVNNILDSGDGVGTQSIFLGNEQTRTAGYDPRWAYEDFVIENNVIANGHLWGVFIEVVDTIRIANNSLLFNDTPMVTGDGTGVGRMWRPAIEVRGASSNVLVEDNHVGAVNVATSDALIRNNADSVAGADPASPVGRAADAPLVTMEWDRDGDHGWTVRRIVHDDTGAREQILKHMDNGNQRLVMIDADDSFAFRRVVSTVDRDGQQLSERVVFDDGSSILTRQDPNDTARWSDIVVQRDSDGLLTERLVTMDDGREKHTIFEDGMRSQRVVTDLADAHDWATRTYVWDVTDGSLVSMVEVPDTILTG